MLPAQLRRAALRTVRAIVEHGSFAAAAQAVGCTPSAVSLQVKQVETRQAAVRPLDAAGRAEGRPA
jgi:DNA-binding transcriptional LysR family regulator